MNLVTTDWLESNIDKEKIVNTTNLAAKYFKEANSMPSKDTK